MRSRSSAYQEYREYAEKILPLADPRVPLVRPSGEFELVWDDADFMLWVGRYDQGLSLQFFPGQHGERRDAKKQMLPGVLHPRLLTIVQMLFQYPSIVCAIDPQVGKSTTRRRVIGILVEIPCGPVGFPRDFAQQKARIVSRRLYAQR